MESDPHQLHSREQLTGFQDIHFWLKLRKLHFLRQSPLSLLNQSWRQNCIQKFPPLLLNSCLSVLTDLILSELKLLRCICSHIISFLWTLNWPLKEQFTLKCRITLWLPPGLLRQFFITQKYLCNTMYIYSVEQKHIIIQRDLSPCSQS